MRVLVNSGSWRSLAKALTACSGLAVMLVALTGCGGGPTSKPSGPVVQVNERDFKISVSPLRVTAGLVDLQVVNHGPDEHELIVVRAADAAHLPLRPDGMTVNEDALARVTVATLEPGTPGSVRDVQVKLFPGRYVLFCNMSGHFMGGMHTPLVVS